MLITEELFRYNIRGNFVYCRGIYFRSHHGNESYDMSHSLLIGISQDYIWLANSCQNVLLCCILCMWLDDVACCSWLCSSPLYVIREKPLNDSVAAMHYWDLWIYNHWYKLMHVNMVISLIYNSQLTVVFYSYRMGFINLHMLWIFPKTMLMAIE